MLVRHHGLAHVAGAHFGAADNEWNVDALSGHGGQSRSQSAALAGTWRIGTNDLIDGRGNAPQAGEGSHA